MKNQYIRGDCFKRGGGLDSLLIQGGAWQERGGGVFEGGLIPQCPLCNILDLSGVFVCLGRWGDLLSFSVPGGQKICCKLRLTLPMILLTTTTIFCQRKSAASPFLVEHLSRFCYIDT